MQDRIRIYIGHKHEIGHSPQRRSFKSVEALPTYAIMHMYIYIFKIYELITFFFPVAAPFYIEIKLPEYNQGKVFYSII